MEVGFFICNVQNRLALLLHRGQLHLGRRFAALQLRRGHQEDRDAEFTRAALAWAEAEGRIDEAAPELVAKLALSDAAIDALIAERTQAKKTRNFARADAIRVDLLAKGILIEDSKEGVRWKRK